MNTLIFTLMLLALWGNGQPQEPYRSIPKLKARLIDASTDSLKASIFIYMSNTYLENNLLDSSLWAAKQAKQIAQSSKLSRLEGWADYLIGSYYFYEGQYDEGIRIESEAVTTAERVNDFLLRASARKMIGWMYVEMGKEKEAMILFKEGLPVFKKFYHEDLQMNIGITYYGVATAYFYLGQFDSALLYYDSAISAKPSMDSRETALALADRAALLRDHRHDLEGAFADATRAVQLLEKLDLQRDASAYAQAELALTYAKLGQLKKAEYWANNAHDLYGRIPLIKRYVSVYKTLSEAFHLTGNYKKAFETERETRILGDSIYKWRKLQVIEDLRIKYETEKKTQEIASLNFERIQRESLLIKNQTALAIVGFTLALAIGLGYLYYRKREKYHHRIRFLEASQQVRLEKERIAKDLHDSLGSKLSTIALSLQRAMTETQSQLLSDIHDMTDKTMNELRDSIWAMNQDSISPEELEQRINNLFWQYRKINLPIDLEMTLVGSTEKVQLSPDAGVHLFRIVQEAVQNSIKHSKASHLRVTLIIEENLLTLDIEDNGGGFQWPDKIKEDHFGLTNMQKRSDLIKAEFKLKTSPGQGTRISVRVPLNSKD
jgi:Signal transduction histidine kinase